MVKHTQTIRRQKRRIRRMVWVCLTILWGWHLKGQVWLWGFYWNLPSQLFSIKVRNTMAPEQYVKLVQSLQWRNQSEVIISRSFVFIVNFEQI